MTASAPSRGWRAPLLMAACAGWMVLPAAAGQTPEPARGNPGAYGSGYGGGYSGQVSPGNGTTAGQPPTSAGDTAGPAPSPSDLQRGIELTRQGRFTEAIPLLLAAEQKGVGGYAVRFNLALCYVGAGDYPSAIARLRDLQSDGSNTAGVNNLLAQAYLGAGDREKAWTAIQEAARLTPTDEKMYALLLNACTDHYDYALGLRVADLGLRVLPGSARLHYERAVLLARLDRLEEAKPEFARAAALGGTSDLGYLALVQERLYEEQLPQALAVARKAVAEGHRDYQMLSLLGTILLYEGAVPGQPEFAEARRALEASVAARADYATSQIALGKLYLMEGKAAGALAHLQAGQRLEPRDPAVYTSLAAAYRRTGNKQAAEDSLRTLAGLLREKSSSTAGGVVRP